MRVFQRIQIYLLVLAVSSAFGCVDVDDVFKPFSPNDAISITGGSKYPLAPGTISLRFHNYATKKWETRGPTTEVQADGTFALHGIVVPQQIKYWDYLKGIGSVPEQWNAPIHVYHRDAVSNKNILLIRTDVFDRILLGEHSPFLINHGQTVWVSCRDESPYYCRGPGQ